jgi:hypothetical protein
MERLTWLMPIVEAIKKAAASIISGLNAEDVPGRMVSPAADCSVK